MWRELNRLKCGQFCNCYLLWRLTFYCLKTKHLLFSPHLSLTFSPRVSTALSSLKIESSCNRNKSLLFIHSNLGTGFCVTPPTPFHRPVSVSDRCPTKNKPSSLTPCCEDAGVDPRQVRQLPTGKLVRQFVLSGRHGGRKIAESHS